MPSIFRENHLFLLIYCHHFDCGRAYINAYFYHNMSTKTNPSDNLVRNGTKVKKLVFQRLSEPEQLSYFNRIPTYNLLQAPLLPRRLDGESSYMIPRIIVHDSQNHRAWFPESSCMIPRIILHGSPNHPAWFLPHARSIVKKNSHAGKAKPQSCQGKTGALG